VNAKSSRHVTGLKNNSKTKVKREANVTAKTTLKLEITNAREVLPRGQTFGLGCLKSVYNPWIIQT
jgi:ribosomal protein L44E